MLYDDLAKELRGPMIDCCMTDLYCPSRHRHFGTLRIGSRKWSALIGQSSYDDIRTMADAIYRMMDKYHCCLPLVQKHLTGIKMEYEEGDRLVTFYITPESDVAAVAECPRPGLEPVYVSTKPEAADDFCKSLAEFLNLKEPKDAETCDGGGEKQRRAG